MRPTEEKIQKDPSDLPIYLFKQGNNCEAYRYFGAHLETRAGESGVVFRVWAPHAAAISVVGDFNSWKPGSHPMRKVDGDSVWELFIPGVKEYDVYKYCVTTRGGDLIYKADPYAFHAETRPSNGSKVYDITGFAWHDDAWQTAQKKADVINGPMNIYEMHAGSWKLKDEKVPYNYSELADELIPYIKELGFRAVTYMPSRNTRAQLERLRALCEKYELFQISGEDINSPRQSFVCEAQRDPAYRDLVDSTWALIAHEWRSTVDPQNGLFSAESVKKWPDLAERVGVFALQGRKL